MQKKESKQKPEKDAPAAIALFVCVIAACALIYLYHADLMTYYLQYYYVVWCVLFSLGFITTLGIAAGFCYVTRKLRQRVSLLLPLSRKKSGIYVGKTKDHLKIHLSDALRTGHVDIVAPTGRGKTMSTIEPWISRDLLRGKSPVLIDGKGDPDIARRFIETASLIPSSPSVKIFDLGNPNSSISTNPLANGSPQQIADRIMTAFTFDDPYYRAVQADITGRLTSLIQEVDSVDGKPGVVTFKRLHELLTNADVLEETVEKSKNEPLKLVLDDFHDEAPKDRNKKIAGLVSQISPFAIGEVSDLVNGPTNGKAYYSVSDLLLSNAATRLLTEGSSQVLLIFLIPTLKYQNIGQQLGKLLMQEMAWAVGERSSRVGSSSEFCPVFIDEFSAFVYEGFASILNKARSSQVALHLSHQSLGDLSSISKEFAEQINTNTNIKCLLGANDPITADFYAKHLGTYTDAKLTDRVQTKPLFGKFDKTGEASMREVEAYKIHPNVLKSYTHGKGVLYFLTPRGAVTEEIQFARFSNEEIPNYLGDRK